MRCEVVCNAQTPPRLLALSPTPTRLLLYPSAHCFLLFLKQNLPFCLSTRFPQDVDGWDGPAAFAWGYLAELPALADVYRLYPNGSLAGGKDRGGKGLTATPVPNTTALPVALSVLDHAETTSKKTSTQAFAYVFTGNQSAPADERGVIATDTVRFLVQDIDGAYSTTANITVEVVKGFYAVPPLESNVFEEEWGPVHLRVRGLADSHGCSADLNGCSAGEGLWASDWLAFLTHPPPPPPPPPTFFSLVRTERARTARCTRATSASGSRGSRATARSGTLPAATGSSKRATCLPRACGTHTSRLPPSSTAATLTSSTARR